jgi:thiamine transport system ATP-binding protein
MLVFDNVVFHRGAFTLRADLTIPKGAQIALTGTSGIGKSTFFDLIAGFEQPSAGHMSWDGRDITPLPPAQRPVAVMFQDHNLFSHLSVMKNLTLAMGQGKDAAAISRLLDQLEIGAYAHTRPTDLSGGQLARAALARVMLQQRPILALDEPFAALDARLRRDILGFVTDWAQRDNVTVLMITHATEDAAGLKDGQLHIMDGQVSWA